MKKTHITWWIHLSVASFFTTHLSFSEPVITFFLRPIEKTVPWEPDQLLKDWQRPARIARASLNQFIYARRVSGVFATYAGFVSISDNMGQLTFPRKHAKAHINLFITPRINPVMLVNNTIAYLELIPELPIHAYEMTLNYDEKSNQSTWLVSCKQSADQKIPGDQKIPFDAIIIFADPQKIEVPVGTIPAKQSSNLILPDLYVKRGIHDVVDSLFWLTIDHFFRSADTLNVNKPLLFETIYGN